VETEPGLAGYLMLLVYFCQAFGSLLISSMILGVLVAPEAAENDLFRGAIVEHV
jgi:hypothetical protein